MLIGTTKECSKTNENTVKGHQIQLERTFTCQSKIWASKWMTAKDYNIKQNKNP